MPVRTRAYWRRQRGGYAWFWINRYAQRRRRQRRYNQWQARMERIARGVRNERRQGPPTRAQHNSNRRRLERAEFLDRLFWEADPWE